MRFGRPQKEFAECSDRAKRYKLKKLCDNFSEELIETAAKKIEDKKSEKQAINFSSEQALALIMDASLSKYQYENLRKATNDLGFNIFPSYLKVLQSKKECYPANVEVTESMACVPLQSLLDHTATRILMAQSEEMLENMDEETTLVSKWGCDGSSGHSEYKQVFTEENISDANMFLTSLVPLCLNSKKDNSLQYWTNPRPSSTRFCRPVKFQYIKETPESTEVEVKRMETQIENLVETSVNLRKKKL